MANLSQSSIKIIALALFSFIIAATSFALWLMFRKSKEEKMVFKRKEIRDERPSVVASVIADDVKVTGEVYVPKPSVKEVSVDDLLAEISLLKQMLSAKKDELMRRL